MRAKLTIFVIALLLALVAGGCSLLFLSEEAEDNEIIRGRYVTIETTAYCPCGQCCHWKLDSKGNPVHSKGRQRGKPKAVGITANGTKATPGTLAADTRHYPMGTVFYIPGYGYGCVEDRGGDIRGKSRLDLFFNTHKEAQKWGRKRIKCVVFPKGTPKMPKNAPPPTED